MAKNRYTTPVMRMVQGDVDEPQTKDQQGNPRVVKTGPNAGQPNPQYFVAGAIRKDDPAWPAFWATIVNQAVADFPNLFPQGAGPVIAAGGPSTGPGGVLTMATQGIIAHPQFSFKVLDGDGLDSNGKPNSSKEGFAGHWVVRFGSSYPPRCFHAGHYAAHEQIQEKKAIKRGFFIRVNGSTEGNGNAQRPGLYLNLDMVELAYVGPEIVSGPSAEDAFAGGPGAMPPGATAIGHTPGASAPPPPPGAGAPPPPPATVTVDPMAAARAAGWQPHPNAPGFHYLGQEVVADADVAARFNAAAPAAPPPAPAAAPASPAAASPAAGSAPPPYTGYMGNDTPSAPAAAPAPATPAAPPPAPSATTASPTSRTMTPKAAGATYEQMVAAGWTDDTLRAHGMMV